MTSNKKLIFVSFFLLIIVAVFWFVLKDKEIDSDINKVENQNCITKIEEKIVRGNSLTGLIENGQTIRALFGYYDCHNIQREDIVLYFFAGNKVPLIKIVKGIPGDKFNLQKTNDGWHILINEKILKNSKNQPYLLNEKSYRMLSLYEKDYQGVIPEQAYLIMSNLTGGAVDATRYGLAHKNDILGKAEALKK